MIIAKFGGSSVRNAERMRDCLNVIRHYTDIGGVVISATYNTTNELELMARLASEQKLQDAMIVFSSNQVRHQQLFQELFSHERSSDWESACWSTQEQLYRELSGYLSELSETSILTPEKLDSVYSIGERLSSNLFYYLVKKEFKNKKVVLLDARGLIATDESFNRANPLIEVIKINAQEVGRQLGQWGKDYFFVTQGFIGRTKTGKTTVLGREGSDYTATLLGEAFGATEVQIWTDVAGVYPLDPRLDSSYSAYPKLGMEQAALMASNGAKVLFSDTLSPAIRQNFQVYVGKTQNPEEKGTLIVPQKQCDWLPALIVDSKSREQDFILKVVGDSNFLEKFKQRLSQHSLEFSQDTEHLIILSVPVHKEKVVLEIFKEMNQSLLK